MLARVARGLAAATAGASHAVAAPLGACASAAALRHGASTSRDVEEANQELDAFFGVPVTHARDAGLKKPPSDAGFGVSSTASTAGSAASAAPPAQQHAPHLHQRQLRQAELYGVLGGTAGLDLPLGQPSGEAQQLHHPQHPQLQQQRQLTHIDATGSAAMVDVSEKAVTAREAQASCVVRLGEAYGAVAANAVAKGDVLKVAQLGGIMGAKATANLIPLCHNIPISKVDVQLSLDAPSRSVVVRALARSDGKTGVEMEALTAACVAALTVYDMCKAAAKDMVVGQLQLDYKSGGRSGTYLRAGLQRADLLPSARPPL